MVWCFFCSYNKGIETVKDQVLLGPASRKRFTFVRVSVWGIPGAFPVGGRVIS